MVLTASDVVYTYQVLNTNLGLQAPTVGNPIGQTSIQGDVTSAAIPEPSALLPYGPGSDLSLAPPRGSLVI